MARIVGGIACSHVPAIGAALDKGKHGNPYWKPYFDGTIAGARMAREAQARRRHPDLQRSRQCVVAADDPDVPVRHRGATFRWPTKALARGRCRTVHGHPKLAWHLVENLILDEFDMTIANEMPVDHGLTVPLSVTCGQVPEWPFKVIPLCVNVIQYPPPTGVRCFKLGQAIRRAVEDFPEDLRVVVYGTGGMSHQLQGERAGFVNQEFDRHVPRRHRQRSARSSRRFRTRSTCASPAPKASRW